MTVPTRALKNHERMHGRAATTGERKAAGQRRHDRGVRWLCWELETRGLKAQREALIRRVERAAIDVLVLVESRPVAVVEHRFRLKTTWDADLIKRSAERYARWAEGEWGYPVVAFMTAGAIEQNAIERATDYGVLWLREAPNAIAVQVGAAA